MKSKMCFYHAIDREDCGYVKHSGKSVTPTKFLPKLKNLIKNMLFEFNQHFEIYNKNANFRIEVYIKNDSPKIPGYTVWMVIEDSFDLDAIYILIKQLAIFGNYYRTKGE